MHIVIVKLKNKMHRDKNKKNNFFYILGGIGIIFMIWLFYDSFYIAHRNYILYLLSQLLLQKHNCYFLLLDKNILQQLLAQRDDAKFQLLFLIFQDCFRKKMRHIAILNNLHRLLKNKKRKSNLQLYSPLSLPSMVTTQFDIIDDPLSQISSAIQKILLFFEKKIKMNQKSQNNIS